MKRLLRIGCLAYLLTGFTHVILGSVLSELLQHYHGTYSDGGRIVFVEFAGFLCGVLLMPKLAAVVSRRRALLLAALLLGAAETCLSLLPPWGLAMTLAGCAGFGFGLTEAGIGTFVLIAAKEKQAVAMSRLEVFFGLGALVMPFISGFLILQGLWRFSFLVLGLSALAMVPVWARLSFGELDGLLAARRSRGGAEAKPGVTPAAATAGYVQGGMPGGNAAGYGRDETLGANAAGHVQDETLGANANGYGRGETLRGNAAGYGRSETLGANALGHLQDETFGANANGYGRGETFGGNAAGDVALGADAAVQQLRHEGWDAGVLTATAALLPRYGTRGGVVLGLFILIFFCYVGAEVAIVNYLPSVFTVKLSLSGSAATLSVTAYWLAMVAGRLVAGNVAERATYRRFMLWTVAGSIVTLAGLALVNGAVAAFAFVLVCGLLMAGMFAVALIYANNLLPAALTERTSSLLIASGGLGGSLLPLLVGRIMDAYSAAAAVWSFACAMLAMLALLLAASAVAERGSMRTQPVETARAKKV